MFEGAVAGILNRLLGKYVQDLDTENLNVGIFSGNVNLTDLKLKPEALYELDLPIDVKIGTIGRINLQIPWTGLYTQPVVVHIEDVLVLVGPAISNSYFDPDREKRLTRAAKRKILQDLEAESEILKGPQNFFESLFTAIVNNLQIYVRNVHVRYEDSISSKDGPLAGGLCLQSLSIETTNSKWKPSVTAVNATTVYQLMRIESLSCYWNPAATVLDDTETAHITPMQYYNWKHYMLTGLDKFSMHREDFDFLLKPVTCKVKVIINRSDEARVPRLLLDAVLQDSAVQLSRRQYLSICNLAASFTRIQLNRKYRHLHPGVPLCKDVRKWWRYAYNVVLEQRVRPYTWAAIKKHRENYNQYKQTYKSTLRSPNDTELKLDLQKCEDNLPIISVVIAREQAKFELLSQEPERIEVVETEIDWWKPSSDTEEESDEETKERVELCVKTERSRSLWSHLSSPERRKVCELIGYVEGAPRSDKSKQYIEHKINLTLANCSLTLMNRSKEVLVVTLTQFLASLETRPSARAYKLSARAESVVVEGISWDGTLVTLLVAERGPAPTYNLLAIDFEKNPLTSDADFGFCCLIEPVQITYVEHAVTELINFFQTHAMSSLELNAAICARAGSARRLARAALLYAHARRKLFQINVDVKAPCLLVPEHGCVTKGGRVLVLDISRIIVKSDLQPSNLVLEDATCMELEERLYDRLHAECTFQILFCSLSDPWRESRRAADSELHVVPRLRAQLVFSNTIKKDYKLLPRYKLNVSLSSFKLNLSDRIIGLMLDFIDNLPMPVPNTVPVSFVDSGDYADEEEGESPLLGTDKVVNDPGYKDLVDLRQKIVAAYLSRNKASETCFDKAGAKLGFQQSEPAFLSSEHSDEDMEVYARSVDLPGFDDNVSPSNTINTLLRFIVGEIVINLSRSVDQKERPYIMLSITKVCLDVALMEFGPAVQLCISQALLTDKQHHSNTGQYLELLTSDGELFNLLYRKVRADCPEFRSHFHSVEQSLVLDVGALALLLHSAALTMLLKYLHYVTDKIQSRHELNLKKTMLPKTKTLWDYLMKPEADPPVPSGATKFSYSVRVSSIAIKLCHLDSSLFEIRLSSLESDCVFRANDRMIFRLYLASLHLDDLADSTLYPKLVWPEEERSERVLELKYVRAAPRHYGPGRRSVPAHGELRARLARLHLVLFYCYIHHLQQFLEPLIPSGVAAEAAMATEKAVEQQAEKLRTWSARLNLVIEIHAPVLLLPQKPSSPNLLVFNMGDLVIENFFKQVNPSADESSPIHSPIIDNILVKLDNVTISRAVMTLAGTLEVQEPILEPVSVRGDIKRAVGYQPAASAGGGHRELLLCEAHVSVDAVLINLGQKDLATVLAVYTDNLSEAQYIGSIVPSSPTEAPSTDTAVKKLQAFFAQGEPIRKEVVLRFTLEGVELKLFSDMDEVLSSPVRDLNHGLAKLTAGEATLQLDYYSDGSTELRASLQSLLIEDIRPDPSVVIRRIFQCEGGKSRSSAGISVQRPPLIDVTLRAVRGAAAGRALDVRVDRSRCNLALPFLLQLARTLLDAMPGDKTMEGGVVNHGYVGEVGGKPPNNNRIPSCDSTSGYYSAASASTTEETPGLSISVQFRQPELMLFTDAKSEGHALLLRAELLVDYSCHASRESLVVSLAGLQVMSKLQSKLKNLSPYLVLKPCDVEFSRVSGGADDGVKVKLAVSDIEVHLAASTVHTVLDLIEEVTLELSVPEDDNNIYNLKQDKLDEDLWSPKKITPYILLNPEESYIQPKYPNISSNESFNVNLPSIKVIFELEQVQRIPVVLVQLSSELSLSSWSRQLQGSGRARIQAHCYNSRAAAWEPLLEPAVCAENTQRLWQLSACVFQAKAYPMSSRLDTTLHETETATPDSKKTRKRNEFESETSADECDTDNEMTFIRNPNGRDSQGDLGVGGMSFLTAVDGDESDSENENGLMDKLATAIGHLFTDDSSAGELSNDEDSSAPQSEIEGSDREDNDKTVTFTDSSPSRAKRDGEPKTVTLQDPIREDSTPSPTGSDTALSERLCTYVTLSSDSPLNITVTPGGARALRALAAALQLRGGVVSAILAADSPLQLINDIGPGSTVHLKTRAETDLAGNDKILAIADYDVDTSRPSTPGCDTSSADLLDDVTDVKPEMCDVSDDWDWCFEGGFPAEGGSPQAPPPLVGTSASPSAPPPIAALYRRYTDETLTIKLHDFDPLTILCPQRTVSKLHVLHPSKNSTRYYIVVERTSKYNTRKIVVRSPLQIRNETSYALELFYKKTDLQAIGADLIGCVSNPFEDKMRLAVIAPHDTYNVPLYIAYHCKLFLLPSNFESYQTATQGIWWMELANELGTPRDMICPAKDGDDDRIFAMRILTEEGCQSQTVRRAIPNYVIRVVAPLVLYNRLPYAVELQGGAVNEGAAMRVRLEAGERAASYTLRLSAPHRIQLHMQYMALPWTGSFTLSPDLTEKTLSMSTEVETDGGNKQLGVCVRVERGESWQLYVFAPYWLINKTGLPLQMKARHSETCYEVTDEPLLWAGGGRGRDGRSGRGDARLRLRAHHSAWSRAVRPAAAAPGLVVCAHTERRTNYRVLMDVTLSELCPQLTKIVRLLPFLVVSNETRRHLRFMEQNEAADLWLDLAPHHTTPYWPQTDSMNMHCKFRDSTVVSQHFPVTKNHFTVLRMDKGSAICVEVTGGTDRPFTITFKPYCAGDAPVRIDNLCDDLFLKLHQQDSGQVALLSPYQSMLYTWDDPVKERNLLWNIYNNKGKGYVADFNQDGYGEEKVSFHSVRHSTLVATSSVTSKLSSTLKRLTPKSPEPCSSSSGDSDSTEQPDAHSKTKKMRKDKVIVYWVSYMDGYQRVFALAQDERIAYQYRMRINSERSNYEVYLSLSGASLSVCVETHVGVRELAFISISDSLPRWEVNVSHKWKQLSPDLTAWIEDKYQKEEKKCNLKEYIHIDLEKMQMTKPFFSELRRTYNPGVWLQLRKSDTYTYCHLKLQRLQIDNQLSEAVFPSVLYPAPPPTNTRSDRELKPCIEIVALKQHRPSLNQDVYKHLKVLIQEFCVNLDRGFVNYVFDILNHWKIEDKPAVRLRADLALVHMPLPILALKSQMASKRNVLMEYVHLSPVKLVLSLSSRGYSAETTNSPGKSRFGTKKENRPKLFNSDLLEYLFNSWGSSLCDMKDVVIRMAYLELRNSPVSMSTLLDLASRHYWTQLVQQFYVLVLGLNILGNPYSIIGDFARGIRQYYEPHLGVLSSCKPDDIAFRLGYGAARLLGHCASGAAVPAALFGDVAPVNTMRRDLGGEGIISNDLPESVIDADRHNAASVALALTGLIARPTFDVCREAARAAMSRQFGADSAQSALRACIERSGGRLVARRRLPRHCPAMEGIKPYSEHAALGLQLLTLLGRGHYADTDGYIAHAHIGSANNSILLVTTQHIFMVRAGAGAGGRSWHAEWTARLGDLVAVPTIRDDKLVLTIKQDELVNYFATDEKAIEVADPEVRAWLQAKIEFAMILALEDKRVST